MSRRLTSALIAAFCLAVSASPASAAVAGAEDSAASSVRPRGGPLQLALNGLTDAKAVSAIAEVRDGDQRWRGTTGVTDLVGQAPVRGDGRFRIGSVTKTFVATTVLQLVGEHRLGLEDSVSSHLPGLVPNGQNITVRQLLNQRTGLFDVTNEGTDVFPNLNDPAVFRTWLAQGGLNRTFTARQLVTASVSHAPYFAPGTQWGYSNTNFDVLGLIIEQVTGHPYGQEVGQRILRPLGMTKTTVPGRSTTIPGPHAHSYWTTVDGAGTGNVKKTDIDVTDQNPSWAGAAGEIISTTDDLIRFQQALLKGKLLRPAEQREMTTMLETVPGSHEIDYGMGLARAQLSCTTVLGHNGGTFGFSTQLWGTADRQVAVSYTPRGDDAEQTAQNQAGIKFLDAVFCGAG
ncbi:serine hydrolase domain-containing protein [Kitasatospora sp. NPDC088264]|uniref:serine hydrolase domain-containing protein n=1 Tax=Kitasatospora sp. NPDC088264 TaxID=3155296 RepID=UPI003448AC6E